MGRVLSGFIVAFWLVMTAALVRVEFFPKPPQLDRVPMERVLQKIFANPGPARLNVYHEGVRIGSCRVDINPLASLEACPADPVDPKPGAYQVQVSVATTLLGRLKFIGQGWCSAQYEIQRFNIKASMGEMRLDLRGDNQTRQVDLVYDDADTHQERHLGFNEVNHEGLVGALGIPSPAHAALLGIAGLPTASGEQNSDIGARSPVTTTACYAHLTLGDLTQPAYLIESKLNEGMWAKIWVDESGQVLLVETSMGLTMRADQIDDANADDHPPAVARSSHGGAENHDSN